ncbi:MAG TPA: hypothetical protein VFI61_00240 [Patescibacteria group bacterium]|nr:hypothetical protein [Patescibacteria group bacterium]
MQKNKIAIVKKCLRYVIALTLVCVLLYSFLFGGSAPINSYAGIILKKCSSAEYKPACYETEIPKLMNKISMEAVFEVIRLIQLKDPSYAQCHTLAHKLSSQEAKLHKTEWKDILIRCPLAMCNYGCLHGSLIEHFRGETLNDEQIAEALPDLKNVCERRSDWSPSLVDQNMCYHALGHLAMYITDADIKKSLTLCSTISKKQDGRDYSEICSEGIFMTLLYPEDLVLPDDVKYQTNNVIKFCSRFTGYAYQICRRESSSLIEDELQDPLKLVNFCSFAKNVDDVDKCYGTVINRMADDFMPKEDWLERMDRYCGDIPIHKDLCVSSFAMRMIQIDKYNEYNAIQLCTLSKKYGSAVSDECFNKLALNGSLIFTINSTDYSKYCDILPDEWKNKCYAKNQ